MCRLVIHMMNRMSAASLGFRAEADPSVRRASLDQADSPLISSLTQAGRGVHLLSEMLGFTDASLVPLAPAFREVLAAGRWRRDGP